MDEGGRRFAEVAVRRAGTDIDGSASRRRRLQLTSHRQAAGHLRNQAPSGEELTSLKRDFAQTLTFQHPARALLEVVRELGVPFVVWFSV